MLRCVTVAVFKETFLDALACESWEDFDSTMPKLASLIEGLLYYVAALEQSRFVWRFSLSRMQFTPFLVSQLIFRTVWRPSLSRVQFTPFLVS